MPQIQANGLRIEYDSRGDTDRETVLIIAGLGGQLTAVPEGCLDLLVERGFRAIRFDNRDVGLTTRLDGALVEEAADYTLYDMAADTVGLMDALGIARAHLMGGSMGGSIAQIVAAEYPDRVLSLTSFMSTSGNPDLPRPAEDVLAVMSAPVEAPGDIPAIVRHRINIFNRIGSPAYPTDEAVMRARFTTEFKRSYTPDGVSRQAAAAGATGDRRERLRVIRAPTVVIHGAEDPLVSVEAGADTAAHIPGAELRIVPGMGHDFPDALIPVIVDAICAAAARSRESSAR